MNDPVDVLIIGAGASGAAVAWSLSGQGNGARSGDCCAFVSACFEARKRKSRKREIRTLAMFFALNEDNALREKFKAALEGRVGRELDDVRRARE